MPIARAKTRLSKRDLTKPWLELVALHMTTILPKTYILPERTLGKKNAITSSLRKTKSENLRRKKTVSVWS